MASSESHELTKFLIKKTQDDRYSDDYFELCRLIARVFPKHLKQQLAQLLRGPVWDGDVMSKQHRGELFDLGVAVRVCNKMEQGYTASKYIGYTIYEEIKCIEALER